MLTQALKHYGFRLVRERKHRIYRDSQGRQFTTPKTPSDVRGERNALSDFSRIVGLKKNELLAQLERTRTRQSAPEPLPFLAGDAETTVVVLEPVELAPVSAQLPIYSKSDLKKLKRWERHEAQRAERYKKQMELLEWLIQDVKRWWADEGLENIHPDDVAEMVFSMLRKCGFQPSRGPVRQGCLKQPQISGTLLE